MPKIKPIDCSKQEFIDSLINPARLHERAIKQRYPFHYEQIKKCIGTTFVEKLYNYAHDIIELPVCHHCGAPVSFINFNKGYCRYCSNKCATTDPERLKRMQQTCIERYGVANAGQSKIIREKTRTTCLERYGYENPSSANEIKERRKKTNIERYGYENAFASDAGKEKLRQTCIEKYGEANNKQAEAKAKHPDIIRFEGRTWICRCPHPECDKCTEKWYETRSMLYKNRKESGAELCTKLLPLQPTISTYELRIRSWLDEWEINYNCSVRDVIDGELDIYIPSKRIAIEFNGTYHHRTVKRIETTGKQKDYHFIKFKKCLDKNIHLISIWQDEILYKEDACRQMLLNYLLTPNSQYKVRDIAGINAQSFILSNFPDKYIKAKIYKGVYNSQNKLAGVFVGRGDDMIEFEIFCWSVECCRRIKQHLWDMYDNLTIKTNNDHISYQMMIDAGFIPKEIRLDEKVRNVNNHGSYPTHNTGTSIWAI